MESYKTRWSKRRRGRLKKRDKCNKQKTIINMVNINPITLVITLNVNGINILIKNKDYQRHN